MASFITIDGSLGEGGGQVLRTAVALSAVTGKPLHLNNIRAGRERPGLQRQHLAAVRAAAEVCGAEVRGAEVGSRELTFRPEKIRSGEYTFEVGSAGSASLVLQTALPPLLCARGPSIVVVTGGTHNPFAPPYEFLAATFAPCINAIGARLSVTLHRHGFYPEGGGCLVANVTPFGARRRFEMVDRGAVRAVRVRSLVANLAAHIGEREVAVLRSRLNLPPAAARAETVRNAPGPGNVALVDIQCERITEVVSSFGEKGLPAEIVAETAARDALAYLNSGVPVGDYLADQLLLPLAMAAGGRFRTFPLSDHATTNIEVIKHFLDARFDVREEADIATVAVTPAP
ncbi:MAG: RNA 3'-terminal phosphate cyclase [Planctomycetes bacterium]|nr:RNA 3'-terminal phosphate cyclase [Planctomycetota bacterium]